MIHNNMRFNTKILRCASCLVQSRVGSGVRVVVGERRRQLPMGIHLGEQVVGLLLGGGHGVSTGDPE
jgi:hypothetical protein